MSIASFTRARDLLLAADEAAASLNEVCEHLVAAFGHVCRFDWSAVMTTDADTMLPTGGVVQGFDPEACTPFWDNELLDPDFNKFTVLARSSSPVATLVEAVDGDLSRSPRYTKIYGTLGIADELRAVFMAGSRCLATAVLVRAEADGPFTPQELADVRELVPVASTVLRRAMGRIEYATTAEPPVVIILDAGGEIASMSAGAERVIEDLRSQSIDEPGLPAVVRAAATRARWSRSAASLATRVQRNDGQWLRLHVSPMEDDAGSVAVTIEQARPSDLVPIMLDAYALTQRETDIVVLLAQGLAAKEIATELLISAHTVRDHIKSIYEKAGVASRGELMARLFSDHVLRHFHGAVSHVTV